MAPRNQGTGNAANQTAKVAANLRQSVSAARNLSFAVANFGGQLNGAVGASAAIAENIAKASRNAKIAASATGIGAVVAIIGTIAAATMNWREQTKEVALKMRDIRNETARIEAQAKGDRRLERELEIQAAMDGELDAAKKMESFLRKFPELQDAIRRKAQAARDAAKADTQRSFSDSLFGLQNSTLPILRGGSPAQREIITRQIELQRQRERRLRDLDREAKEQRYGPEQIDRLKESIGDEFQKGMADLQYDMEAPARQLGESLGHTIASSIADGISEAIKNRSFGDGFKAITGSILIGFGNMLQEIGTQSLLAANLLKGVIDAFRSFAPEGAIAQSLALIAAGGVMKGLGASMSSSSSGGASAAASRGASPLMGAVVAVSPSAAAGGSSAVTAGGANIYSFTLLGERDPTLQRQLVTIVEGGLARKGRRL